MKNIIRVFVVVFVFCLFASVSFCAAKTAPIQSPSTQDGPIGGGCVPIGSCIPITELQPVILQDGPIGGGCVPIGSCIPFSDQQPVSALILQDGPIGGGCVPIGSCIPSSTSEIIIEDFGKDFGRSVLGTLSMLLTSEKNTVLKTV